MGYFYILGTIIFTVYGQIVLKWRVNKVADFPEQFSEQLIFLFKLLLDPWIFSGLFAAFVASFFWIAAMTKFEVSYAYPLIVGGLAILTSIFAVIFLKESYSLLKATGLLFIIIGVYFLSENSL
ncbi:hypothetical protein [Litorilituus lipolyticus]|uniref:EamA domain-containing protein n=1 Tax=Litorilituus lipolyticus TaxID=2491017 RepID=A0A502L2J5_9GAMM|nr:hypothetical protein [Litorilituus lipolyticus]TPH17049.1 hypothetical protein EPA86_05030 [Litorilituus lipolyticus]